MRRGLAGTWKATLLVASFIALVSCGGGGSDNGPPPAPPPPPTNAPPTPTITSPAEGLTYKAGDTLTFEGSATDPEDGALPASNLTWWVEFHHDEHSHPFIQPTQGASGTAVVPTRNETSDNVWLRFHFKAVDSAGQEVEVIRDIFPQKSQFTLATQPPGLTISLDGQPLTAPQTITGVVGLERDLSAMDQNFNGRRYTFSSWSDGGAATHTIFTPANPTTFTATFIDSGPATNAPPVVTLAAPASGVVGAPITLDATASDDESVASVEFFDGTTSIGTDTTAPFSIAWTPATTGVHTLTARATDNAGASTTSAPVSVTITAASGDVQPPTVSITEPAAFANGLTGNIVFSATATDNVGVANVELQVDGQPVATLTAPPFSTTIDTTQLPAGQHVLRARATDVSGNRSDWTKVVVRISGTRQAPVGITRTPGWVSDLPSATAFTQLPDGRILVALQTGQLRVVMPDGTLLAQPMLTVPNVDDEGERGLLGVTPHPNFAANGFIYVYYTTTQNGSHNRISRFTVAGNTAANELVLADLPGLGSIGHNGGALHFGGDGKLYAAVGENYRATEAQNINSVWGKLLRFNDDGTIPADNPFCTTQGNLACAVWAYGLRNPFTFAVQPGTGRIFISDVGEDTWEEINEVTRGANFGWPLTEGPTTMTGITAPFFTYRHGQSTPPGTGPGGFIDGTCVIGGGFYPDSGPFPATWRGGYLFADLGRDTVNFIDLKNGNDAYSFGRSGSRPVGVLVAQDGSLLVLTQQSGITRFTAP